jgi:hypothetical protein
MSSSTSYNLYPILFTVFYFFGLHRKNVLVFKEPLYFYFSNYSVQYIQSFDGTNHENKNSVLSELLQKQCQIGTVKRLF